MRTATRIICLIAIVGGAAGLTRAKDDEAYDLRGPAPIKGQVIVSKNTFRIKGADLTMKVMGQTLEAKQTMTAIEEEDVKILVVTGRQATKVQSTVTKDQADSVTTFGGQNKKDSKPGELKGEIIISERIGDGKWKHILVDNKPTEKQQKELDKRMGPESQDVIYPEGKIKIGHEWTVDATALQRVFGNSIIDLKGKLKMKFVKLEEIDGEKCAVIESAGKITGVAKEDEGDLDVELDLKGTTWRSLKTGLDIKDKATGKMKMSGEIEMDGQKGQLTLNGPITIDSTSQLKK